MTQKKKKLALVSVFAAVLAVSVGMSATIAYLGQTKDIPNKMKVGRGDLEISEDFSSPEEVSMISEIDKKFKVENTGTVPSFARLYAEFSDSEVADKAYVKIDGVEINGESYIKWSDFKTYLAETETLTSAEATLQAKTKWRYVNDNTKLGGYFYYTELLDPNDNTKKSTTNLFDTVKVDFNKYDNNAPVDSNIDRIVDYEMIVYSEIIQNTETGLYVSGTTSEYGYEYKDGSEDPTTHAWIEGEWKEAWKSFLREP